MSAYSRTSEKTPKYSCTSFGPLKGALRSRLNRIGEWASYIVARPVRIEIITNRPMSRTDE
jgi:hypothetical protein